MCVCVCVHIYISICVYIYIVKKTGIDLPGYYQSINGLIVTRARERMMCDYTLLVPMK